MSLRYAQMGELVSPIIHPKLIELYDMKINRGMFEEKNSYC